MNELIKLIIEYKESKCDYIFEQIVTKVKRIIISKTFKVPNYYRDDFYQELLECLVKVIDRFMIKRYEINPNLFNDENLKTIEKRKFTNVNNIMNNCYILDFINKYGTDLFLFSFKNKDKLFIFVNEFNLFCNENQFIKYLNTSLNSLVNLLYRRLNKNINFISLNFNVSDGVELVDLIADTNVDDNQKFYDESLLREKDKFFLSLFIENGKRLTGNEVGKKLNITQQAVSIRLKRIKLRYIKAFNNKYLNK